MWRTAALYEAERGGEKNKQTVWVKVAHSTPECENRLRDEALYLQDRLKSVAPPPKKGLAKLIASFSPAPRREVLLQLLPASPLRQKSPFGETTVNGLSRVFCVYAALQGATLRQALLENPQVWHYEAAWTTLVIAHALRTQVADKRLHLSLTPSLIYVYTDDEGHWRPTLLDLGWLWQPAAKEQPNNATSTSVATLYNRFDPAYTAPEVMADKRGSGLSLSADVYSLGMVYFEMLAGRPGVPQHWRRDEVLIRDVIDTARKQQRLPIDQDKFRPELTQSGVVTLLEKALGVQERLPSIAQFVEGLARVYGNPPPEKRKVPIKLYILAGVIGLALLAVLVAVVMAARG